MGVLTLLNVFFGIVSGTILLIAGVGSTILFIIAAAYILWPTGDGSRTGNGGGLFSGEERYDDWLSVAHRINEKLDHPEAEQIMVDMAVMDADRARFMDKKTQEWKPHWSVLSQLKHSTETVRIIYDVKEDKIASWNSNPSPLERDDLFANFNPDHLQRVMSRKYGDRPPGEEDPRERDARPVELKLQRPQNRGNGSRTRPPRNDKGD